MVVSTTGPRCCNLEECTRPFSALYQFALRCDAEPCQRSHALLLLRSALIPDCRSSSSLHLILAVRGGAGEALMLGEFGLKETLLSPIEVGECPN
jgi:hypothetical protein